MNHGIDIRPALPAIHVPTLVLARDDDSLFTAEETKWMADQIHGARFVSFPGVDHLFWAGNQDELLVEIERFVAEVGDEETDLDRVLATVMFTDIVGSTAKAAELGDRGWGDLVEIVTTASSERSSAASGGPRSTRLAMGSSPHSMAPRAASGAPRRSAKRLRLRGRSTWRGAHGRGRTDRRQIGVSRGEYRREDRGACDPLRGSGLSNGQRPGFGFRPPL